MTGTVIKSEDQEEIAKAMYDEKVALVYVGAFSINLAPIECIIGIGFSTPHDGKVRYTHRLHMPLALAEQLQSGLSQIFEMAKQQQAAAASVKH